MRIGWLCAAFATVLLAGSALPAQRATPLPGIRAEARPISYHIQVGQPVWVRFSIENTSHQPITLTVPGTEPEIPSPESGLPLTHVFSGPSATGITVTTEAGRRWDQAVGYRATSRAPILMIAPRSSVGLTLDVRDYFPVLRGAGRFRLTWHPYGGAVTSDTIVLTVASQKQAQIVTDQGTIRLRFLYEEAPNHIVNFIELIKTGFYNGKTFHRVEAGYFIQGGCPRGDGTGIRLDGKRLPAEFSGHPMRKGTVAMALLEDDPESASCQFFICNTRQKEWDGRYTAFAELVGDESFETLDRLMAVEVDDYSRPLRTLTINNTRIIEAPADAFP